MSNQRSPRPFESARRMAALPGLAAAGFLGTATMLGGCYAEGGLWWSEDQHVYVSRPYQPWTVTLRDTRSGQEFWSIDVPVGQKLVVHFLEGEGTEDTYTPDRMEWALLDDGEDLSTDYLGDLRNSLPVPPASARRLDPALRPTPEAAPGTATAAAPGPGEKGPAPLIERPTLRRNPPAVRPTPSGTVEPVPPPPAPEPAPEAPAPGAPSTTPPANEPPIDLPE